MIKNIFNQTAKTILTSITSMTKSSSNAGKECFAKIFKKVSEKLNLTTYKIIETMSTENTDSSETEICSSLSLSDKENCGKLLGTFET